MKNIRLWAVCITALSTSLLQAQPNLTSFRPDGWSDVLVTSKQADDFFGSTVLNADQDIFVHFAVVNSSDNADVSNEFRCEVFVDDVLSFWVTFPDLNRNMFRTWINFNIGALSPGNHTIKLVIDTTGVAAESDETDNIYQKPIAVSGTGGGPANHRVNIMNFAFTPQNLTIDVGDTVEWVNQDTAPHTTTSDTGVWDSGTLQTGKGFQRTFSVPGTFPYHCEIHPSMRATITVAGGGGNKPNLEPFMPEGWADRIVVSHEQDDFVEETPLRNDQDILVHFS